MAKKWRDLDTIRDNLDTAKKNVAKYTKELKETQEHELIKNSNEMFEKFKKLAGDDSKMEDMLAYFQNSIDNANPEDFKEEEVESVEEATADETEAAEETDEVDTSSLFENNTY